jgi:DNA sulfur modification protein DndD
MKLIKARFENFRLLRNLEVDFSRNPDQPLTVIRAANDTGKTTMLTALQWALYGDEALPGNVDEFRLHPIDWETDSSTRIPIMASVEFEVTRYNRIAGQLRPTVRRYRIDRSTYEDLDGSSWRRSASTVRLYAISDTGTSQVDSPDSVIADELPRELRDVFFTDGDRALSFIESTVNVSTKRERVQRAIRSLLGLEVLEEATRHVKKTQADINKRAKQLGGNADLTSAAAMISKLDDDIAKLETERDDAKQQMLAFGTKLEEINRKIEETLKSGDREKLARDIEAVKKTIGRLDEQLVAANKEHTGLFRSEAVALGVLGEVLTPAFAKLDELRDRGKIPNATIPVLEERLSVGECICGETLSEDGGHGSTRRKHVCSLIERSRQADLVQETVTELYFGSKGLQGQSQWLELYTDVVKRRDGLQSVRNDEGRKLRGLEVQLDGIPDVDIQNLRQIQRDYLDQVDRFGSARTRAETLIETNHAERTRLIDSRDKLLRQRRKGERILSELEVAEDILNVLDNSYKKITNEELFKVSSLMNEIFLDMIGADPQQGAIIRRAEISKDYDILVYGPNDRTLNPDRDLNGASRRALTLAFILALTKVSEVEAPNVIDTPLGMMSGYVKRSVLKRAIRESSQLVLFLTHSEITNCEEILDRDAGAIFTLTNTAHYPKQLVNDPGGNSHQSLKCGCNHRSHCGVCERRQDGDAAFEQSV